MFFDRDRSIAYRKFKETEERGPEDLSDCVGGLVHGTTCKFFATNLWAVTNTTDLTDANCVDRLYDLS